MKIVSYTVLSTPQLFLDENKYPDIKNKFLENRN